MTQYLTCDWCGCEAWWPRNRMTLTCDCGHTVVTKMYSLTKLSPTAIRLADQWAESSPEENRAAMDRLRDWVMAGEPEGEE